MDKKFALTNHVWNRAFLVCPTFLDFENIWTITNTRRIRVANLHLWPKCDLSKYWIVRTTHKCCSVFESYIRFCLSGSEFYSATRSIVTQWCNRDACFHRVYRSSGDGSTTQTRTQTIYSSRTLLITDSSELNRSLIHYHIMFKAYVHDFCDRHDCQSMI